MDAGDRWMLNDAAGKPMLAWDSRGHTFRTEYDELHRPVASFVKGADPLDANRTIQFERVIYGDTPGNGLIVDPVDPDNDPTKQLNLRGKPYKHHDTAGLVTSLGRNPATGTDEAFDFKGNLLRSTRQLLRDYKTTPDWSQNPRLEAETFASSTRYDALNRPIQIVAPHSDLPGSKFNVIRPGYNEANLLERVDVWLEQPAEPTALLNPATANLNAVTNIDYDAKGQRIRIEYNEASHPIVTRYSYDENTFRLTRLLTTRPAHPETDKRTLQDLTYTYDPVGNITTIRDKAQQPVFFNNIAVAPTNAYVYDALYRLVRAEGREHAAQNNTQRDARSFEPIIGIPFHNSPEALQRYREDYEYDPVGNILGLYHTGGAVERWIRRYQYAPDSNRLLATRLPGDPNNLPDYTATPGYSAKYSYDKHGNMNSMPHLPVMKWDFKDQLRASQQQINNGGTGEKTWYVYDAGGQRVRKVTDRQNGKPKDERIYLGGYEVYRKYDGNGQTVTLERETLHVMDDKQRVALIETRTRFQGADPAPRQLVRYQLGNHLASVALELDDEAEVISYEEYHPYGTTAYEAARSQAKTPKRYRYTGKERNEETGLTYHAARYYAGWLGRWISGDPIGIEDGNNVYAYVQGNPTCKLDPTGTQDADFNQAVEGAIDQLDQPGNPFQAHGKSGGKQWATTMDIDEPRAVGQRDISPTEARARATDVNNRQFLDPRTNRQTKHLGTETRPPPAARPPVSVVDKPDALLTRRFSEVTEMEAVFNEAVGTITNPNGLTPTALKKAINSKIWDIIKTGTSDAALKVRGALASLGFENVKGQGYVLKGGQAPAPRPAAAPAPVETKPTAPAEPAAKPPEGAPPRSAGPLAKGILVAAEKVALVTALGQASGHKDAAERGAEWVMVGLVLKFLGLRATGIIGATLVTDYVATKHREAIERSLDDGLNRAQSDPARLSPAPKQTLWDAMFH